MNHSERESKNMEPVPSTGLSGERDSNKNESREHVCF